MIKKNEPKQIISPHDSFVGNPTEEKMQSVKIITVRMGYCTKRGHHNLLPRKTPQPRPISEQGETF